MKPSLSLSLIESLLRSEGGHGGQQMSPELLNKALTKFTQFIPWKCRKKPNGTLFASYKPGTWCGNRHTQNDLAHAPRVNKDSHPLAHYTSKIRYKNKLLFQCLEGNFNNLCGQLQARSFPICSMYVLKITVLTNLFVISWQYFFAIWSCCICWGLRVGRAAGVIRGPVCSGMDSAEFKCKKSEFTISGNLFWIGQHLHVHVATHV